MYLKYFKIYDNLIERARSRKLIGYTESHHIIPKCLGGSNLSENLVNLTAREHFIAHRLLCRMYSHNGLKFALVMMTMSNLRQQRTFKITSRTYEEIKKLNSIASSKRSLGKNKHNVGKKCYYNILGEERLFFDDPGDGWTQGSKKKSFAMKGILSGRSYWTHATTNQVISLMPTDVPPEGFVKGRSNSNAGIPNVGKKLFHNPISGEAVRSKECPEGYVSGSLFIWITNGIENKQINNFIDEIPEGWSEGRTIDEHHAKSIMESRKIPITTPLGEFSHPRRFCEEYNLDYSFFENLDNKIRSRKSNQKLILSLDAIGYDFSKTKRENGFDFIKEDEDGIC